MVNNQTLDQKAILLVNDEEEDDTYYINKPFENEHVTNIIEYLIGNPAEQRKQWLELKIQAVRYEY